MMKSDLVTLTVRPDRKSYRAATKRAKAEGISFSLYLRRLVKQDEFNLPSDVAARLKIRKLEKSLEERVSRLESQLAEWGNT